MTPSWFPNGSNTQNKNVRKTNRRAYIVRPDTWKTFSFICHFHCFVLRPEKKKNNKIIIYYQNENSRKQWKIAHNQQIFILMKKKVLVIVWTTDAHKAKRDRVNISGWWARCYYHFIRKQSDWNNTSDVSEPRAHENRLRWSTAKRILYIIVHHQHHQQYSFISITAFERQMQSNVDQWQRLVVHKSQFHLLLLVQFIFSISIHFSSGFGNPEGVFDYPTNTSNRKFTFLSLHMTMSQIWNYNFKSESKLKLNAHKVFALEIDAACTYVAFLTEK